MFLTQQNLSKSGAGGEGGGVRSKIKVSPLSGFLVVTRSECNSVHSSRIILTS